MEALLKIAAWGFILAPNTYMRSGAHIPVASMLLWPVFLCSATGMKTFNPLSLWSGGGFKLS